MMYRFLVTPKWLAGIALAVTGVVVFVNLGFWQLSRLEERRAYHETLTEHGEAPPVALDAVVDGDPETLAFRRVALAGTFEPDGEVLLTPRSLDGRAGHHVLTPLRTDQGVVVVDRGWVPLEETQPPIAAAPPPQGRVEIEGLLLPPDAATRSGAFEGGDRLEFVNAPDLALLEDRLGEPAAPLYVLAQAQEPANPGRWPAVGQPPVIDEEGNHFSYALQWFGFAGVVLVGFPILVVRTARDRRAAEEAADAPAHEPART